MDFTRIFCSLIRAIAGSPELRDAFLMAVTHDGTKVKNGDVECDFDPFNKDHCRQINEHRGNRAGVL